MKAWRRRICSALLCLCCLCCAVTLPASAEATAQDLTDGLRFSLNGEPLDAGVLTDGSIYTKMAFSAGDVLTISGDTPISTLYLKFDREPGIYLAAGEREKIICGQNGFLHECIPFSRPTPVVTLTMPQKTLCDVFAYTDGALPDSVQRWNAPYDDCDMLLVPTHADDEHLFFGSLLPTYSREGGRKLQVVYLTNHWGEPYRPHELLDGLWEAGITAYPVMSPFPDVYSESLEHAKTIYDTEKMRDFLITQLRRFRPEVVIGHDLSGEYGHGVHQLNAWLLCDAVKDCEDPAKDPASAETYGAFSVQKLYLHLYPENPILIEAEQPLASFNGKTAFEVATDAFAHHRSQQEWFTVEHAGRYDFRKFGLYRSTVGENTGNDPFEHVLFSDSTAPEFSSAEELPSSQPESSKEEEPDPEETTSEETDGRMHGAWIAVLLLFCAIFIGILFWKGRNHRA